MGGREYDRSLNEKSEGGYDVMASYSTLYIIGTQYNGWLQNTFISNTNHHQHQPPPTPTQKKSLLFNVQSPYSLQAMSRPGIDWYFVKPKGLLSSIKAL